MRTDRPERYKALLLMTMALLLVACTKNSDTISMDNKPVAVGFDAYLRQHGQTRADGAVHPNADATDMTIESLKKYGFGVFAHYTGSEDYKRENTKNFMFNQKVEWNTGVGAWTYTPTKYWPNDNTPADDQDNDTGNDPATGSQNHSYLHFFAYAPFYDYKVHAADYSGGANHLVQPDDYGLTDMPSNESDFYLIYRSQLKPGKDVDVLWAKQDYMYKTKPTGEGYTAGRVPFVFQHALSRLGITVMGLFDHASPTDKPWEGYGDNVDENTRIQVEELEIPDTCTCIPDRGRWYLDPKDPNDKDKSSYNRDATSAYWEAFTLGRIYETSGFNSQVAKIEMDDLAADNKDKGEAKVAFEKLRAGVNKEACNLFQDDKGNMLYFMFPPNNNYENPSALKPLRVRVKYRVITYDERLTLNNPKFFSIVENDITADFDDVITFKPNKEYRLRLLLGLTSVKFEVLDVTDWETPILLAAVVKEWEVETHEYDIE